jgi:hypothetical protein
VTKIERPFLDTSRFVTAKISFTPCLANNYIDFAVGSILLYVYKHLVEQENVYLFTSCAALMRVWWTKIMPYWLASSQAVTLPLFASFPEDIFPLASKLQPCCCTPDI